MIHNSDYFYKIGSSHSHCDDYACISDKNIAIISDGCSGSSKSNYGAMILPQAAIKSIYCMDNKILFQNTVLNIANESKECLDLPEQSLDATLFVISINEENCYYINAYGDGAIIKIRNDNTIELIYIEYLSGAPLYLNYLSNQKRFEEYKKSFGIQRKISKYTLSGTNKTKLEMMSDIDESEDSFSEIGLCSDYKAIIVTSDGLGSFIDKDNNSISVITIVKELIDFKGYKGEFIKRRMNGFGSYCEKQGWKHTDDFSMAGIHIDHEK